jgi:hypothetical protein
MNLFAIKHRDDKSISPPFFSDKMKAKAERTKLGDDYIVVPGPDHRKFNKPS